MYRGEDDRVCTLGLPNGPWKKSGNGEIEAWDDPTVSKVGGYAIWHDANTAPKSMNELICGICKKSEDVVLVLQLFAPTDFDRSLYVFCCNKRQCSLQSMGWIVVRNQKNFANAGEISQKDVSTCDLTQISQPISSKKSSVWDFLGDAGNEEDDLLALLADRNININNSATPKNDSPIKNLKDTPSSSSKKNLDFMLSPKAIPVCQLKEEEEEWDNNYDEEEADIPENEADTAHINSLINSYLNDEDDAENLMALRNFGIGNKDMPNIALNNKNDVHENDEDEEEMDVKKGKKKSDDDLGEEKLSFESSKHKTELYFQKRVSCYPNQILRYAYDGQALWITSPSPIEVESKLEKGTKQQIPVCQCCGAQRVFECQLMPALLTYITKYSSKKSKDKKQEKDNKLQSAQLDINSILGETLDYGVVTIWTCPNSCTYLESRFATECAIVQPPPDFS